MPSAATVVQGGRIDIAVRTRNAGRGRARRSTTAVYLSANKRKDVRDVRLSRLAVPVLIARRGASRRAHVTISVGQAPRAYRVLACADDRAKVHETREHDNCRVASKPVTITAFPGEPGTSTVPGLTPVPVGQPSPDQPPAPQPATDATLVITTSVVNDHGGTATPAEFTYRISGAAPVAADPDGSTSVTIAAGGFTVEQISDPRYTTTPANRTCSGTAAAGATTTCAFTNDDIAPLLYVKKVVVNDDGRTATPADFTMTVTGESPTPASFPGSAAGDGTLVTLHAGAYSASETAHAGYDGTASAGCTGTIAVGQTKHCTITNDDAATQPVSIPEIRTGTVPLGALVQLSDAVVTARGHTNWIWVQEASATTYGGIAVSADASLVETGDSVSVEGTVGDYDGLDILSSATVTVTGMTSPLPPIVVDPASIATGAAYADAFQSMLVRVENVSVTDTDPAAGIGDSAPIWEFVVDGGLRVNDLLYRTDPWPTVGTPFSLTGILDYRNGDSKLEPRGASDIVAL